MSQKTLVGTRIAVLDKGYVRLVDFMGSDLSVVNAARASFAKESKEFGEKDERLLDFLMREEHTSPLRHCFVTFEVKAPLFVARQWWRYIVSSAHTESTPGWSEASRRYITMEPEFYVPDIWRKAPENRKQGSGGVINDEVLNTELGQRLQRIIDAGLEAYEFALEAGVAPEQARLFLPAYGMYTIWRWSCSLQSVLHFLSQRLADDAQWEIRQYAEVVLHFVEKLFPITTQAWLKYQVRSWKRTSTSTIGGKLTT